VSDLNPQNPRITFVIPSLTGGGAERQMSYLVNHAVSKGYSCTLVTLSDANGDKYELDPKVARVGLDVIAQSAGLWESIVSNRRRIKLLRQSIVDSGPTAVVSFCDRMNIMTLAASRTSKLRDVRVAICERSDPRQQKLGWAWESLRRIHYPHCDRCVVQTKGIANYLTPIVGRDKPIHIIPTAIQPGEDERTVTAESLLFASKLGTATTRPKRLLYVGRLSHEKGVDRLLQVWSQIYSNHPEWRLVVAGEGPEQERWLRSHAQNGVSSGVESSIDWLGWVSGVQALMACCDVFVLPSRYEGFPNALVEAMDSNLPCIATDCSSSIIEIIPDDHTGLRVENSFEGLKAAVSKLLSNETLRTQFREKAKLSVAKFTWSAVSSSWDSVLASLTATPSRQR
jgi:glycosyltransferase involved in cell wall biosynthesis